MNDRIFDIDRINAYLLGSLSDEEAERFDELSFTDDAFTEALYAAEIDLRDAYVHDDLSQAERKQFESQYLSSPLRREKVNFARVLKEFGEGKTAGAPYRTPVKQGVFASVSAVMQRFSPMRWGIAAAVMLLTALGGWLLFQTARQDRDLINIQAVVPETPTPEQVVPAINDFRPNPETEEEIAQANANEEKVRLEKEIERKKAQELERIAEHERARIEEKRRAESQKQSNLRLSISVATFILLPPHREAGQLQEFTIPEKTGQVSFQIELEAVDYPQYRAELSGQGSEELVWKSRRVKASAKSGQNRIFAQIPSSRLTPKIYTMVVYGINPDGTSEIIGDYSFRVVQ